MKMWNTKRNKRFIGSFCLMLSMLLMTVPLLGMASANATEVDTVSGNDALVACICETKCTEEVPNLECPVCKETVENCAGITAEPENLPCFCEVQCTKDAHDAQCPACAADMDLCIAPPAALEPIRCLCVNLCLPDAVNQECTLCLQDVTQCVGIAAETEPPAEPDQPTEPVEPTEPEEPDEPETCTCTEKCVSDAVNIDCSICKNDLTPCVGVEQADPKFTISILEPDGWYTDKADVEIRIKDVNETGWENVKAKINSGGSWIDLTDDLIDTDKVYLEISENCTIYVTVTDKDGKAHTKNRYIEVFDREAPTVRAGIDDELLRVEANDDLSGVYKIYVCGNSFSKLTNGTLDIRLKDYADDYEKITIQAVDHAGNKSRMTQLNNPYYEEPEKDTGNSSVGTTTVPTAPSNTVIPFGSGTTLIQSGGTVSTGQTAKPTASTGSTVTKTDTVKDTSAAETDTEEETEANPFTPAGNATVVDNATDDEGKEFYTITTPNENIFYLIIDKQREGENVYFLNAVTESDLMALAQKDENSQTTAPVDTTPTEPVTQEPEEPVEPETPLEEPEQPAEKGGNSMMLVVVVIALAAGGLGYYFKVYKPKHELDDAEDIDDFEFEGPEEPMVNEDEETAMLEETSHEELSEEEEAEQRRLYEEDNEDIPVEGDDDLVF